MLQLNISWLIEKSIESFKIEFCIMKLFMKNSSIFFAENNTLSSILELSSIMKLFMCNLSISFAENNSLSYILQLKIWKLFMSNSVIFFIENNSLSHLKASYVIFYIVKNYTLLTPKNIYF